MPKIILSSPIHDKLWVLPYFLKHVSEIEGLSDKVFLANNCSEDEIALLKQYGKVYFLDTVTSTTQRGSGRFKALVELRNRLMDIVFNELKADYMLSIDSDILAYPRIVKNLLQFEKDVISCLVFNDLHFSKPNLDPSAHASNILRRDRPNHFIHIKPIAFNMLQTVESTGACVLMSKKVYDLGIRYDHNSQGEDQGFALHCIDKGIKQYCHTRVLPHLMSRQVLKEYINNGIIEEIGEK